MRWSILLLAAIPLGQAEDQLQKDLAELQQANQQVEVWQSQHISAAPGTREIDWPTTVKVLMTSLAGLGAGATIYSGITSKKQSLSVTSDGTDTTIQETPTVPDAATVPIAKGINLKTGQPFKTGARRSPLHKVLAAPAYRPFGAAPAQFSFVPKQLDMWGNAQYGDCHDENTEVLTEKGWVPWPEYDGESMLATVNPATLLLEYQSPTRVIRKEHDGVLAYGIHKGQDFALTPRHRMYLRPYKVAKDGRKYLPGMSGYGAYEFRTIEKAPSRFLIPGAPSGFLGTRLDKLTIGNRQWDGMDFIRLLSLVISDGYVSNGETNRNRVSFCCFREDRLDMVRGFAHKLGIREEKSRPGVWVLGDMPLADWLRSNIYVGQEARSPCKRIPDLLRVASQDQVEEFLRFYGDQSFCNGRDFYTSSPYLADDLQELLLHTGKRANIRETKLRDGHFIGDKLVQGNGPSYALHVWEDSDVGMLGPKNKKRSIVYEHYKGEVFCASVPNSTLITRRNGSVLISGNCVSAEEAFAKACYMPEIFIPASEVESWASQHGVLNGADLSSVMDWMKEKGFQVGGQTYNDGNKMSVDYSNEAVLQAAISDPNSQGPVKIAIDANALPSGAGNNQGWAAFGGSPGEFGNTDHCVAISGYGPTAYLFQQLGVPVPAGAPANGYHLYTWSTIGVVDHAWIMSTCVEAWTRQPTTVGVPPLPGPTPSTLAITTAALPPATAGSPYAASLSAAGGTAPYTWSAAGLPSGLSIVPTGAIAGAPITAGSAAVMLTVTDATGKTATATLTLTVGTGPGPGPGPGPGDIIDGVTTVDIPAGTKLALVSGTSGIPVDLSAPMQAAMPALTKYFGGGATFPQTDVRHWITDSGCELLQIASVRLGINWQAVQQLITEVITLVTTGKWPSFNWPVVIQDVLKLVTDWQNKQPLSVLIDDVIAALTAVNPSAAFYFSGIHEKISAATGLKMTSTALKINWLMLAKAFVDFISGNYVAAVQDIIAAFTT
jgi:hypothetical protein